MKSPTKKEYEKAQETIKQYEDRQKVLTNLGKDLSYKLQQFDQVKFKVDKKAGEVLFTGIHKESGKLLLGKTVCGREDEFELVIGKLVAIKKALNEDIEEVVKHVESKEYVIGSGWGNGALIAGTLNGTTCIVDAVNRVSSNYKLK
ncbi:hypothetical protein [Niallia taxi]|uniref:hypothetical protein n=1 Tax=Niallia taxi TaxID=2499688 RepID=UPI0030084CD7